MTWHMRDDVAVVWTSTALRANRYSCTLVWAEWVRAHEGWRKDGFGRELDPQSCTTGKSIPVCGLTELVRVRSQLGAAVQLYNVIAMELG